MAGEVDPVTGFVVDLKLLKEILEREVVECLRPSPFESLEIEDFKDGDSHDREHGGGDLETAGREDSECDAASVCGCMRWTDLFADFYGEFEAGEQ